MPKYLIEASYTPEGVIGIAEKGGTARQEPVGQLIGRCGILGLIFFVHSSASISFVSPSGFAVGA